MDDLLNIDALVLGEQHSGRTLGRRARLAARTFLRRLDGRYEVVRVLVYGSFARGDAERDSDLDLAVILAGEPGDRWAIARDMARLAFDVLMETEMLVDPLPLWEIELVRPESFRNPVLLRAILRDGLAP